MPAGGQLVDQRVDLGLGADVHAARRLVEDQDAAAAPRATWPARSSAGCRPTARRPARRGPGARTRSRSNGSRGQRALGCRRTTSRSARAAGRIGSVTFSRPLMPSTSPCRLRSSGTRPMPGAIAAAVGAGAQPRARPRSHLPASRRDRGRRGRCATSERPAPTSPARPSTSPAVQREARRPANCAGLESPSTRSSSAPGARSTCWGKYSSSARPIMSCTSAPSSSAAVGCGGDVPAVAQHGDGVAQPEDLRPCGARRRCR